MSHSGSIAVLDVETTGLWPGRSHRIIEVGVVRLDCDGQMHAEFESLVNPDRDLGPTFIHGISAQDVAQAPSFPEVAPLLVDALRGCSVIAAYNARFDLGFLRSEFHRIGLELPEIAPLCCMHQSGGRSLQHACEVWGLDPARQWHSAIDDARATAELLVRMLRVDDDLRAWIMQQSAVEWPLLQERDVKPRPRSEARAYAEAPRVFLKSVLSRRPAQSSTHSAAERERAYVDLLDRVLEDRLVGPSERDALLETAQEWGLSRKDLVRVHRAYLNSTISHALADGALSEGERLDILLVGQLLGMENHEVCHELATAATSPASKEPVIVRRDLRGKRVCFTGEFESSIASRRITRGMATQLASSAGMEVLDSVGPRRPPDFLVVGDPNTQSRKAKTARSLGVRLVSERVFWQMLGVSAS